MTPSEVWLHVSDKKITMDTRKASYVLEEEVQLRMTAGVDGDLKQRHEDVLQHFLKVAQLLLCVIDVALREIFTK